MDRKGKRANDDIDSKAKVTENSASTEPPKAERPKIPPYMELTIVEKGKSKSKKSPRNQSTTRQSWKSADNNNNDDSLKNKKKSGAKTKTKTPKGSKKIKEKPASETKEQTAAAADVEKARQLHLAEQGR